MLGKRDVAKVWSWSGVSIQSRNDEGDDDGYDDAGDFFPALLPCDSSLCPIIILPSNTSGPIHVQNLQIISNGELNIPLKSVPLPQMGIYTDDLWDSFMTIQGTQ